jgi:hypothetical protein
MKRPLPRTVMRVGGLRVPKKALCSSGRHSRRARVLFDSCQPSETRATFSNLEGDPWTAPVKKGTMPWDVRGAGVLVRVQNPAKLIPRVTVADSATSDLRLNQVTDVDAQKITLKGHVSSISPFPSNGMCSLDIRLNSPMPEGVGVDLQVNATIHLGALQNILYVGWPVHANPNSSIPIFKLVDGGQRAIRVNVKFGRTSVNIIEVLDGLKEGDEIIPSDMSAWDNSDQVHLK